MVSSRAFLWWHESKSARQGGGVHLIMEHHEHFSSLRPFAVFCGDLRPFGAELRSVFLHPATQNLT